MTTRTLLIVGAAPGTAHVGEILLARSIACLSDMEVVVAAVLTASESAQLTDEQRAAVRVFECPPHPPMGQPKTRVGRLLATLRRRALRGRATRRLTRELEVFATAGNFDRLWAILNSPSVIEVAARLSRIGKWFLYTQVWDDMAHIARYFRVDRYSRGALARDYAACLRASEATGVICEAMGDYYRSAYGGRYVVVRAGAPHPLRDVGREVQPSQIHVGVSGSLYAGSAWRGLLSALELLGWSVGGKRITLHVWSSHVALEARAGARVVFHGWRPEDDVRRGLAQCDALYIAQPFEPHDWSMARLSFPTKLSLYVGARRPLFIHAPEDASVAVFNREHQIGLHCASTDPVEIASSLAEFIASLDRENHYRERLDRVAEGVLSEASFETGLRELFRPSADAHAHRDDCVPRIRSAA